jgi:hypothetical protein
MCEGEGGREKMKRRGRERRRCIGTEKDMKRREGRRERETKCKRQRERQTDVQRGTEEGHGGERRSEKLN